VSSAAVFGALALSSTAARAAALLGQPTPGAIGFQPAGDEIKRHVIFFHDDILMPIITAICVLVLGLLIYICIRFNKRANPTPARFTHNTQVEIIWTVAPVLILMFIAIFSFRLLYAYHDMPKPDLTVKATGNQWYWNYTYPDHGGFNFDSLILAEDKAKAVGKPYRLGVDNPLVVPTGKVVRVLVTGADVIHDFALPAFGLKTDAVPGKVNETWFKADKPGIYYGQCSELCGVDHAFMPIEIDVVTQDQFNAWIVKKGGKLPGAPATAPAGGPAAAPAAAPASPSAQPAPGAPAGAAPATGAQPGQTAKTGLAPAAKAAA
jgi:cytochrome c oxidase subunit 2